MSYTSSRGEFGSLSGIEAQRFCYFQLFLLLLQRKTSGSLTTFSSTTTDCPLVFQSFVLSLVLSQVARGKGGKSTPIPGALDSDMTSYTDFDKDHGARLSGFQSSFTRSHGHPIRQTGLRAQSERRAVSDREKGKEDIQRSVFHFQRPPVTQKELSSVILA